MADAVVEIPIIADDSDSAKIEEPEVKAVKKSSKAKEKTPKTKATPKAKAGNSNKSQKKTVTELHPKYSQMINESIAELKERNGSSRQAILKYIMANYNVLPDEKLVNNHVKMSIRAGIKSGKLKQMKGSGACGSYKLGEKVTEKQAKPKAEKSPAKKTNLTKVKKPKAVSKKSKPQSKKATGGKSSTKASPHKTKASPKKTKTTKKTKSLKKTKAKKATKSPKKSMKATVSEEKKETNDVAEAQTNESN